MAHTFRVWAPLAETVELVLDGQRSPMHRGEAGWWSADHPAASFGAAYGFAIDGGDPLPDPRSRWQPDGVHGLSRLLDTSTFTWTDGGWGGLELEDAIVYELHIGTFTPEGTLDAAARRLDHLVDLGVTAVELLPVNDFPGMHGWGYDGVHLWAVHRAYGGPEALAAFVDACHARGIAVLLDVVYNHLGPDGNYLPRFGPYLTDRYRTPWGGAINVDGAGSDEVRAYIVENAVGWLTDYHLDGLRLDAVHAIVDTSATHILEELAGRAAELERQLGRRLLVIAESDLNDPRLVRGTAEGGYGLDAQWSDDFHHALHAALTGEHNGYYADFAGLADVATALRQGVVYDGRHSSHRDRRHGRPYTGVPPIRLLGYLQNHDQVGNRAAGERSAALLPVEALRAAAALVVLGPFTPMLFAGEEWGASTPFQYFTDHGDPELGAAVSQGRRREFAAFGWSEDEVPDPQDPATFERSKLDWEELGREPHRSLLDWHRRLIALRRARPDLRGGRLGDVEVDVDEGARVLTLRRGATWIGINLGAGEVRLAAPGRLEVLLAGDPGWTPGSGGEVVLPPGLTAVCAVS